MTDVSAVPPPFGSFPPSRLQGWLMRTGASMPPTRLGRKVCTSFRSVLRRMSDTPIDAEVLGQRMRLHPSGNAGEKRLLISPQYFDPEELAQLSRMITPEFAFVDIGANVGTYTLFVATHAGARSRILAVEPHPIARQRLQCNLTLNALDWVIVAPVAISDSAGELELHLDARNIGSTSAKAAHVGSPSGASFRVAAVTLQSLLETHGFKHVDALKIDIEGVEDVALVPFFTAAAERLFPRVVIIEDNRRAWQSDLFGLLEAKGYTRHALNSGNVILERRAGRG